MRDEFQEILNYLDMNDSFMKELPKRIIALCASVSGVEEAIKELKQKADDYEADIRTCENVPFCNLLLAFAYWHWGDQPQAAAYAGEAANQFNLCGDRWNRALSLWGQAVVHQDKHIGEAITDYRSAYGLFNVIAIEMDRRGQREKCKHSKSIATRIMDKIKELEGRLAASTIPADSSNQPQSVSSDRKEAKPYAWPTGKPAQLIYPIYDSIRAGKEGKFVFDTIPTKEAVIETITFEGKAHIIYNIMDESNEIVLHPEVYRWIQVEGDSMNAAFPVPVDEGDYVLVLDINARNIQAIPGNIVVAAIRGVGTSNGSPGIIKRWSSDGQELESESTNEYKPIPIKKASIRGVAIAVAKPKEKRK